jgi:hypothetical protein
VYLNQLLTPIANISGLPISISIAAHAAFKCRRKARGKRIVGRITVRHGFPSFAQFYALPTRIQRRFDLSAFKEHRLPDSTLYGSFTQFYARPTRIQRRFDFNAFPTLKEYRSLDSTLYGPSYVAISTSTDPRSIWFIAAHCHQLPLRCPRPG